MFKQLKKLLGEIEYKNYFNELVENPKYSHIRDIIEVYNNESVSEPWLQAHQFFREATMGLKRRRTKVIFVTSSGSDLYIETPGDIKSKNQKKKLNLSIISESEAENNKSFSKVGTPKAVSVIFDIIQSSREYKLRDSKSIANGK